MSEMNFETLQNWFAAFLSNATWELNVFIIIFLTLTVHFFLKRFIEHLQQRLQKTNNPWDDALVFAAKKPLGWLIWLLGISLATDVINVEQKAPVFDLIEPLKYVGVIVLLLLFVVRFLQQLEKVFIEQTDESGHKKYDAHTVEAIYKLLRIAAIITAVLVILQTLGFSISGVLAFGGIGGIAIGFAAKDLLANFFGGLMIYLDRPFTVGDWIRSNDREIEGTVEKIGWRLTSIRTFDKRPLYIPNSVFANIAVENPSRMSHRRIYETIGIRYDDSALMAPIVADVKAMLLAHDDIDTTQTMIVNFNSFAASSLDFFIYTFTRTTNWIHYHEVKQDVLLKVLAIIEQHGAEVAFPTSTVHLNTQNIEPVL